MKKRLLLVIFPIDENAYALCLSYFEKHFQPMDGHGFSSNIFGPVFLAMFFIGALVDRPKGEGERMLDLLIQSQEIHQKSLNETIKKTITILKLIPITNTEMSRGNAARIAPQKKQSFDQLALGLIFTHWHKDSPTTKEKLASPLLVSSTEPQPNRWAPALPSALNLLQQDLLFFTSSIVPKPAQQAGMTINAPSFQPNSPSKH